MTVKRFEERYEGERIVSVKDNVNDKNINIKEMIDLLNALYEENQKLKKENAELEKFRYSIFKRMGELYEEQ